MSYKNYKPTGVATMAKRTNPCPSCPMCGEKAVRICLQDDGEFHCSSCDAEFGVAEVREHIKQWERVLAWMDAMPAEQPKESRRAAGGVLSMQS